MACCCALREGKGHAPDPSSEGREGQKGGGGEEGEGPNGPTSTCTPAGNLALSKRGYISVFNSFIIGTYLCIMFVVEK